MAIDGKPLKVLIEATKLMDGPRDGCYRYTSELLRGILKHQKTSAEPWSFYCYIHGKVYGISSLSRMILARRLLIEGRFQILLRSLVSGAAKFRQKLAGLFKSWFSERRVKLLKELDRKSGVTAQLEYAHQGRPIDGSEYDVVHLTLPQSYRCIKPSSQSRFVVTIHDCTHRRFPEFHLEENVKAAEEGIQFALDRRAHFITNSNATCEELLSEYKIKPDRVTVTPLAVDRSRFTKVEDTEASRQIRSKYGIPELPFFLTLSTLEPRKNLINTVRAFVRFRREYPGAKTNLVIAGREGWKFGDVLSDQSARDDRIFFTGYVEDDDLPVLYSGAIALLFVSHYEGFGLPALEGMSCGLPVIFGATGALPEVVGDAGIPADPNEVGDIQEKLARLAFNSDLREDLSLKALARVDQFSWADTVEKTLEVYQKVADSD